MDPNAQNPQPAADPGTGMPAAGGVTTPPAAPEPVVPATPAVPAVPVVETPVEAPTDGGTTPPPAMPAV